MLTTKQIIESSPALKLVATAYTENFILASNGVLNIHNNLTENDCEIICQTNKLNQLQFPGYFIDKQTFKLINSNLLIKYPDATLRVDINEGSVFEEISFLKYLPDLKSLSVYLTKNEQIDRINDFLDLKDLGIGGHKISLKGIEKQISLQKLFVYDSLIDVDVIQKMPWLNNLTFSTQTLNNLEFLIDLSNLKELHFILGGTTNLAALPKIGKIEKLSFMRVRQLMIANLLPINEMKYLKELSFDTQPHLSDLNWLKQKNVKTEVINCKNFKP
jgi:hypothetical protein